jgi:hypothetical protein
MAWRPPRTPSNRHRLLCVPMQIGPIARTLSRTHDEFRLHRPQGHYLRRQPRHWPGHRAWLRGKRCRCFDLRAWRGDLGGHAAGDRHVLTQGACGVGRYGNKTSIKNYIAEAATGLDGVDVLVNNASKALRGGVELHPVRTFRHARGGCERGDVLSSPLASWVTGKKDCRRWRPVALADPRCHGRPRTMPGADCTQSSLSSQAAHRGRLTWQFDVRLDLEGFAID